ncbi:MAG: Fic family protein [Candidatus Nomurabacteria bacterium]|jgi:Fic family protein|nr:Fic family protein [Candidatus Nomurabacteria bacterium]
MNDTQNINERQRKILKVVSQLKKPTRAEIEAELPHSVDISKPTLLRELSDLESKGLIFASGESRAVRYSTDQNSEILYYVDVDELFNTPPDERMLAGRSVHEFLDIIERVDFLTGQDLDTIARVNEGFLDRVGEADPTIFKKEIERFTIELAWKSSAIEGNTYSLIETEQLLKNHQEAFGKSRGETQMILNHKIALDYILEHLSDYRKLSLADVMEIHRLLTGGLEIAGGIRDGMVRITGTRYIPPSGYLQIREYLERLIDIVNEKKHPVENALIISGCLAYLQPFVDGNKRTSRLVSNAILLAHNHSALSYRAVSEGTYKKGILLIDEQQDFYFHKQVFLDQYYFASENYLI